MNHNFSVPIVNERVRGGRETTNIFDLIYPVGAIYISVDSTSPATLFGGDWEAIEGRMLIGADSTYTAGSTGGAASHTLTTGEMPSHNHTFTGSAVTSGTISADHSHTGTSGDPSANHTHSGPNHWHYTYYYYSNITKGSSQYNFPSGPNGSSGSVNRGADWAGTDQTGTVSSWHTHTTTTGGVSANHTHSVTASGSIGNAGSGNSFSLLPPYLSVYMWKRIA